MVDISRVQVYRWYTVLILLLQNYRVMTTCFSSRCSKVLKLKILMDTLGQKYATRAQNKAFWLVCFPVQKPSSKCSCFTILAGFVKWLNMNWKLIHMISTNTIQWVEGVVHVFIVYLVVPSWLYKLVISHNFLLTKQY
jgi:hypothetical protein